jgi:hypothetical protein
MLSGNVWQSLFSFCIGATISAIIISLLVTAHQSEDGMYELAIADLEKQVKDSENNYDLMRQANQSLQKDKDELNIRLKRQAQIICNLDNRISHQYIELDKAKAQLVRAGIGSTSIDSKGNIV